uniref:DnaK suppressor protein n=1 Tax=uncultured gamma proteobacterium HF0010_20H22 TaxID=723562 RepID=E7C1P0_9GAMM|nr:DnaK suppressor protein [uncultured gamma proteobacterium HF0010_20H22]
MATKNSKKPTKTKKPAAKKVTKVQKKPIKKSAEKKPVKPLKKAAVARKAPKKAAVSKKSSKKAAVKVSGSPTDFSAFLKNFQPYRSKKSEKYMNKNQQRHFLGMLTAWKEALIEEQEKTEQLIQQDQSNFPDSLDRAAKEEEFMLELRKRERERKLIAKIDLSLKDLADDLYGYCESCGVEIGIKRLEARPTATKCIDCKTVDEIKEKQQFG